MRTKWFERWATLDITQRGSVVIAEAALYQLYPSSETKVDRSSANRVREDVVKLVVRLRQEGRVLGTGGQSAGPW